MDADGNYDYEENRVIVDGIGGILTFMKSKSGPNFNVKKVFIDNTPNNMRGVKLPNRGKDHYLVKFITNEKNARPHIAGCANFTSYAGIEHVDINGSMMEHFVPVNSNGMYMTDVRNRKYVLDFDSCRFPTFDVPDDIPLITACAYDPRLKTMYHRGRKLLIDTLIDCNEINYNELAKLIDTYEGDAKDTIEIRIEHEGPNCGFIVKKHEMNDLGKRWAENDKRLKLPPEIVTIEQREQTVIIENPDMPSVATGHENTFDKSAIRREVINTWVDTSGYNDLVFTKHDDRRNLMTYQTRKVIVPNDLLVNEDTIEPIKNAVSNFPISQKNYPTPILEMVVKKSGGVKIGYELREYLGSNGLKKYWCVSDGSFTELYVVEGDKAGGFIERDHSAMNEGPFVIPRRARIKADWDGAFETWYASATKEEVNDLYGKRLKDLGDASPAEINAIIDLLTGDASIKKKFLFDSVIYKPGDKKKQYNFPPKK